MTYKDIMAAIGTLFSAGCLAFIVWVVWSGIKQANRIEARRRQLLDERIAQLGQHVIVVGQEERVN